MLVFGERGQHEAVGDDDSSEFNYSDCPNENLVHFYVHGGQWSGIDDGYGYIAEQDTVRKCVHSVSNHVVEEIIFQLDSPLGKRLKRLSTWSWSTQLIHWWSQHGERCWHSGFDVRNNRRIGYSCCIGSVYLSTLGPFKRTFTPLPQFVFML